MTHLASPPQGTWRHSACGTRIKCDPDGTEYCPKCLVRDPFTYYDAEALVNDRELGLCEDGCFRMRWLAIPDGKLCTECRKEQSDIFEAEQS